ncbi:hypothetical protein SAMN02910340_02142 [Methanosarcina thermophila]|jgi:transcription elongation factor Elf1|uniref:Uncharacterized protein n=3 Tax=Methanosarcina thermophila TaxID=2210 RepID=A0A1I7AIJ4_METTE|nr:hypothetical protein [Methanosarcina thermophila]ALK06004.1 MAG: hypothetical protein AAY43_10265 [Methanosarcina sp. 795]AKB12415.1 hypothetical protein MSTHT_0657 [Methanosarcina thermophila TM-1]AKB14381.1 hypothetical protein MSTHC_0063 [Methanosarcina thermophila CHTI-55]NLU57935.1 hypothetical protein [Methanosarcina thermophila]SFT74757.1 hypothetical protein SAMN02910340_02142 [Methanosarcina thermophila]
MICEPIKCPHCGYRYRTDVEKFVEDGEIVAIRTDFSDVKRLFKRKTAKSFFIDLKCPNCEKEFEWEVKT